MNIKRVIAAAALAVVPLTASSTALAAPAAPQGAPAAAAAVPAQVSTDGVQYANTVLNKVNELRSSLGLKPVTRYQELDAVAQDWSEHQASADIMDHRPDFTSAYPAGWTTGSENVAWRTTGGDTGALIFDQWLNSPGHYKNMVDPNVNSIGIGFAQTSSGKWYATQNFAAYNPSNTPLTPTTTSNTPPSTSNTPPTTDTLGDAVRTHDRDDSSHHSDRSPGHRDHRPWGHADPVGSGHHGDYEDHHHDGHRYSCQAVLDSGGRRSRHHSDEARTGHHRPEHRCRRRRCWPAGHRCLPRHASPPGQLTSRYSTSRSSDERLLPTTVWGNRRSSLCLTVSLPRLSCHSPSTSRHHS